MATLQIFVLAIACITAQAIPPKSIRPSIKNTIFGDERLEGEVFENVDFFESATTYDDDDNPWRLPGDTEPINYNLFWRVDMTQLEFNGTVDIQLAATNANVSQIVIHSDELTIYSLNLADPSGNVIPTTYSEDSTYAFLIVDLTSGTLLYNETNPEIYNLSIAFGAELRDDMRGLYKSWYRNNPTDTDVSWIATTQFESIEARYAFPCYDEPKYKATFDVTVRRPMTFRSWSATRIMQTINDTEINYADDIYYTTPRMSSYLLSVIVAEYESLVYTNTTTGELLHEVIARPGAIQSGQGLYAFEVSQQLEIEMSEHTAINYFSTNPQIKMTQAAINDFSAGAMENWGLLTYREASLMFSEDDSTVQYQQGITNILSHEIAHMWFGNLITMEWWSHLWLKESFARFYQYFLSHWVQPELRFDTRFITTSLHTAMLADSANNPHPLNNPGVTNRASISAMYSSISYDKGACIIRQTEHLLGFEVHRQGLRNYLADKSFDVVYPEDLFSALENVAQSSGALEQYGSNFNFTEYYFSWSDQPGLPVLNVEVNHDTGDMIITQRRFNINTGNHANQLNYIIPITFSTASNPDFEDTKPSHIIKDAVTVINRGSVGDEWVIFNRQQVGYYRVNYDDYTWDLIILALRGPARTQIHEYNKAQIVNDVFQFARSGLMSYTRALNILSFLEYETEYAPWVAAVNGFTWLRNRLEGTTFLAQLDVTIASWATTVMNQITYTPTADESFMTSHLRYQLAPFLCNLNVTECKTTATTAFRQLVDNGIEVPKNIRNYVYCNALREGNATDFNFLWNRYNQHNVYNEKIILLSTLGCTRDQASLNTFLTAIVEDNYIIRPQDFSTAWNSAVSGNEENTLMVFEFFQNNMETTMAAFGGASSPLSSIGSRLRTEEEIAQFEAWAAENQATIGDAGYQTALSAVESQRLSIQWAVEIETDIFDYLTNGNQEIDTTSSSTTSTTTTTEAMPVLIDPETPVLPDSATSVLVSASVLLLGLFVNILA